MSEMSVSINQDFTSGLEKVLEKFTRELIEDIKEKELNEDYWMNLKEAAEWIGISYNTLNKWRIQGLKVSTLEGISLVSKKEINRFLEQRQN